MTLCLYRGVPVDRYSRNETIIAYWGFSLFWGKAVSQNKKGHLIGHIKVKLSVCLFAAAEACTGFLHDCWLGTLVLQLNVFYGSLSAYLQVQVYVCIEAAGPD